MHWLILITLCAYLLWTYVRPHMLEWWEYYTLNKKRAEALNSAHDEAMSEDMRRWGEFLKHLKEINPDMETVADRLHDFLAGILDGKEGFS